MFLNKIKIQNNSQFDRHFKEATLRDVVLRNYPNERRLKLISRVLNTKNTGGKNTTMYELLRYTIPGFKLPLASAEKSAV